MAKYLIDSNTMESIASTVKTLTGNNGPISGTNLASTLSSAAAGKVDPPSGSLPINSDGTYDVTQYAEAVVQTAPTKGIELLEWNVNGYPEKVIIRGTCGNYYLMGSTSSNAAHGGLTTKLKTIEIIDADIIWSESCKGLKALQHLIVRKNGAGSQLYGNSFQGDTALTDITFYGNAKRLTACFNGCTAVKRVVFNGNISNEGGRFVAWDNPFTNGGTQIELYDFSHCTEVFALSSVSHLPHADGCVIKVPQSLLLTWQQETNWCNLPTDSNKSGYVVWEGVSNE